MFGQFEGHVQHVEAEESHPRRPVRLAEGTAIRKRFGAIKRANIVESEEPTLENILTIAVFPVHPPGEVQKQFLKHSLQEPQVLSSIELPLDFENSEGRPAWQKNNSVNQPGPRRNVSIATDQACTGGFTSEKFHS